VHRAADAVQGDPVAGRERLRGADPRHDLDLERDPGADLVEHRQRPVVQPRVAPDQERAGLTIGQRGHEPLEHAGAQAPPLGDRLVAASPRRVLGGDDARRTLHVAGDDLPPQLDQLALLVGLLEQEQHVGRVERADGLHRHVLRIAGADPDHEQHSSRYVHNAASVVHTLTSASLAVAP
jgi:hypothetical protein